MKNSTLRITERSGIDCVLAGKERYARRSMRRAPLKTTVRKLGRSRRQGCFLRRFQAHSFRQRVCAAGTFLNSCVRPLGHSITTRGRVTTSQAECKGQLGLRQVARSSLHGTHLRAFGGEQPNDRADRVAIRFGSGQAEPERAVSVRHIVPIEKGRPLIGGDQKVDVAIVIEISIGQATGHFWQRRTPDPASRATSWKRAAAVIEE